MGVALLVAMSVFVATACSRQKAQPTAGSDAGAPSARAAVRTDSCGGAGCRVFETAEAAFREVLAQSPAVLAVGETHAQKGTRVRSATRRFREDLLPLLRGRASDLVIELWVATGKCGQDERSVATHQKQVTVTQAETNQSEFVALGDRAKALGIAPHALVPSCAEYATMADAAADDVAPMLEMIARRTAHDIELLLDAGRREPKGAGLVVAYGGAMHNDRAPRPGHEAWSFGPELSRYTNDRYVELDLIVREFVKDSEAFRAQPWYPYFDATRFASRALLFNPAPGSYALVFPEE